MKTKILICTDSCVLPSGLAETLRHIFYPLLRLYPDQYEIEQLGYFHPGNDKEAPWPIHRTQLKQAAHGRYELDLEDKYGQKSFDGVVQRVQPDIVFGYGDLWHFSAMLHSPLRNHYRLCCYYTVDGEPYYGGLKNKVESDWGKQLARCDQLVALSHFGKRVLDDGIRELDGHDIKVMYHPIDMARYPTYTDDQLQELRQAVMPKIMAEDAFLCGWMGRNQFRKQNYKLWELCHYMAHGDYIECEDCGRITTKEWDPNKRASRHTDELTLYDPGYRYDRCWYCQSTRVRDGTPDPQFYLWLHMSKDDPGYNCDLEEHIWDIPDNIIYTSNFGQKQAISKDDVARLQAIWDVHYYPSGGEGFGNPPWETLAAGTPVVYANYSAHAEFCQFGGLPVRVGNYTPELGISIRRSAVDTNHAVEQMLKLRRSKALRQELGQRGRQFASRFSLEQLAPAWHRILQDTAKKPLPSEAAQVYATEV